MARKIIFEIGEFYHLYNRGSDKRTVFETDKDYERFLALLYLCNNHTPINIRDLVNQYNLNLETRESKDLLDVVFKLPRSNPYVSIGVYCLMPNHFHLLVREIIEDGISHFMHKLSTAYTLYFNQKNQRSGALFQGRFKAEHAASDEYLKYLFSYIHLNPIKLIDPEWKENGVKDRKKAEEYLSTFSYSSYFDYMNKNRGIKSIISPDQFPTYFESIKEFDSMTREWLHFNSKFSP